MRKHSEQRRNSNKYNHLSVSPGISDKITDIFHHGWIHKTSQSLGTKAVKHLDRSLQYAAMDLYS